MRGTSAAGCTQMVKRQGRERRASGLAQGAGSSDFLQKKSLQGWGRYVAMAVGLVTARDGESWRREEQGEGRKEEKKEVHL